MRSKITGENTQAQRALTLTPASVSTRPGTDCIWHVLSLLPNWPTATKAHCPKAALTHPPTLVNLWARRGAPPRSRLTSGPGEEPHPEASCSRPPVLNSELPVFAQGRLAAASLSTPSRLPIPGPRGRRVDVVLASPVHSPRAVSFYANV